MTLHRNTAEGQASGTTLTGANSGGGSGDAFSTPIGGAGGTCVFSNAQFMHGSQSYLMSATAGNTIIPAFVFPTNGSCAFQFYFRIPVLPSANVTIFQARNASGVAAKLAISTGNKFVVQNSKGVNLTTFATTIVVNTWYRLEIEIVPGTTITNGTINAGVYLGDAAEGSPVDARYAPGATVDAGGSAAAPGITQGQPGIAFTGAAGTFNAYYDDMAYNDGTSVPIGISAATVPGAPTGVVPTPNNGGASIAYTAPASTGGSAITGYTVTCTDTVTSTVTTFNDIASPTAVTGLTNGDLYSVTVHAVNAIGNGPESAAATFTPATVPVAPTVPLASAGIASASITFTPPASTGGSPITGYTATSSPGAITGSATNSPITVAGLTNGTAYTFTVHATNAVGNSVESVASNSVTPVATSNNIKIRRSGAWGVTVIKIRRSGAWVTVG